MKHLSSLRFSGRIVRFALCTSVLGTVAVAPPAQAQPDVNNAPKADNPVNRAPRRRPNMVDMTPEQRVQERLRRQLLAVGVTDTATQEKITAYVQDEIKAQQPLMEKARQLQVGLRGDALSNAQVAALLNDYQAAVEEDKVRHLKAQADLKKAVDLPKMPKVETLLTLMGLYGDGPNIMGGMMGMGFNQRTNRRFEGGVRPNTAPPAQGAPATATKPVVDRPAQ